MFPLASCLMPTFNRRPYVARAIAYFQRQTYENRELVILDDGDDSIGDLVPDDPRIRYLRAPRFASLGAKRNAACEAARGDILLHWDDDDWYAIHRVEKQVEALLTSGADLCGINRVYFLDPDKAEAWEYVYPPSGAPWVCGAALCFRRDYWRAHPFPALSIGEDTLFAAAACRTRMYVLPDKGIFVGLIHPANTCARRTHEPVWRRAPLDEIKNVLGADWATYAAPPPHMANPVVNIESTALAAAGARGVAIGVHVHAEPERLRETLDALSARTPGPYELLLLVDGPDAETRGALAQWTHVRQSATAAPQGASACFNRLARETAAPILVFLESGTLVGPGWLEQLLGALDADLAHGLSCPSTNRAWNQLAQYPGRRGEIVEIERAAADAQRRFGGAWSKLTPLLDVADFCLALRREAYDAAGPADEGFGLGPCWEMDFSARAARAGFASVWAQGAYVFRHPPTARRAREEARLFETSRRRYQDKVCGMRRQNPRAPYASHCKGEACRHFAPEAKPTTATRGAAQLVCRPLVSCVMPTKGRPEFMLQSIRYFQRQTCPDLELIIVDASPRSLAPFLPDDPRIRHFSVASRLSLGAMRNFGSEQASGEILVQWDDDDWYGPERLSAQVQPIRDGVADITGLTDTRFFVLDQWKFWLCSPELHRRMFRLDVSGGTLAFRRSLFGAQCRYPDASLAEDAAFLQQAVHSGARLKRLPSAEHYLYLRHAGNTWSFQCGQFLDPSGWIAHAEPEFLHDDRSFYVARSAAKAKGAFAACAIPTPVAPPALT